MQELSLALIKGFVTGGGLIVAIGAQNAFVLTQGAKRQFPGSIATTCFVIDALLIVVGVSGMGSLIQQDPVLLIVATLGGALFLTGYSVRSFKAAYIGGSLGSSNQLGGTRRAAIMTTLALSLLNPHVYLDTVVLLGAVGGTLPVDDQIYFTVGAVLASFIWFYTLAYGARYLAPVLSSSMAWRVLDVSIGMLMLAMALSLWINLYTLCFN